MNIAIILEYFNYFLPFHEEGNFNYFYITNRRRFTNLKIHNLFYFDWQAYKKYQSQCNDCNWEYYFKMAIKLNSIEKSILPSLAILYENFYRTFFEKNKISIVISGGVTGFERCALKIANEMKIKTLCIWEGFFRPNTISIDEYGMNAESKFYKKSMKEILIHLPSLSFNIFYKNYLAQITNTTSYLIKLKKIQGDSFKIFHQLSNRIRDRHDIERIRVPIWQHMSARLLFHLKKYEYRDLNKIKKPFVFFPLQVHTDSNILLNSPITLFENYLEVIKNAYQIKHWNREFEIIIKEHPFDLFRISYKHSLGNGINWILPNIPTLEILNHPLCLGSIVVNSTAGFESLLVQKPVIVLGNAIYDKEKMVIKAKDIEPFYISSLFDILITTRVNFSMVKQFSSALYDDIQIQGNLNKIPDKKEILNFETYIKS